MAHSHPGIPHLKMTKDETCKIIQAVIESKPLEREAYTDMLALIRQWGDEIPDRSHYWSEWLREQAGNVLSMLDPSDDKQADDIRFFGERIIRKTLCFDAKTDFDAFLRYVEIDRPYDKQFYNPRRHYLKPIVDAYQEVLDGKLHLLTISLVKRGGKSQLGINFTNMVSGMRPDRSTLMEGTGDDLVKSFYNGCLEYLTVPSEYRFYDVFPNAKMVQTNADTKIINLEKKSRFPTIMCRSLDARQVGLSEATNLLYLDDCVDGYEEAHNKDRLDLKWSVISGDVMGRAIEGTPIVACGTRYSIHDPIGHLQEEAAKNHWAWRAIEIPALDKNDHSNYEYVKEGQHVFTTQFFMEQRSILSAEQWESEFQQEPFEAKGLLFPEKDLNRFYALPIDCDADTIIAVCDTAEKGSDYTSMVIAALYGEDAYIIDVVFDNSVPDITKPECAKALVRNEVATAMFESNNAGEYYARDVDGLVKELHGHTAIKTKRTISNKQTRIEFASDNIIKHFYFWANDKIKQGSQYADFLKQVTTYTRAGKVPHDDAPDSLSLLENEIRSIGSDRPRILHRPY